MWPLVLGAGFLLQMFGMQQAANAAHDSAVAQKQAIAAQGRQAEVEAHRARISQIRESRIRSATVLATSQSVTAGGTSGVGGAMGSILTQAASNVGTINTTQDFAQIASKANQKAADANAKSAEGMAIAQFGGSLFSTGTTIFGMQGGFQKPSVGA